MIDKSTARVGVLLGGIAPERPISLKSGAAVSRALRARGWNVVDIDVGRDLPAKLLEAGVTHAWLALHGPLGEDGCVQGLLEVMRIPYTGSGVRGSAIAMDKISTKRILAGTGVPLPEDRVWRRGDPFPEGMVYPVMAKTPEGGSTLGIRKCHDAAELASALEYCQGFADHVLLEQFIDGYEITVAVLEGEALPVVKIEPDTEFFDFEAKYTKGRTRYLVPAPIPETVSSSAQAYARVAYDRLGLTGVARADFMVDAGGTPWFLEINTLPGMTEMSLSPMAAGQVGMSFEDLVERLLFGARCHVPDFGASTAG
jgi:D-alanine-D-alanine ligase